MSKETPILFSASMIRAILAGSKTQTRRIIKPQPELCSGCQLCEFRCDHFREPIKQPFHVGNKLWVRETWREALSETHTCYAYRADNSYQCGKQAPDDCNATWKPSIFMPKKACRLWLEVTNVRVERLQDITEEGAIAEGIEFKAQNNGIFYKVYGKGDMWQDDPLWSFRSLWESINGAGSWDLNPFIWVVEFKKC